MTHTATHEDDDGLLEEHQERAEQRHLEGLAEGNLVELFESAVTVIASLLAELLGLFTEKDGSESLRHD